MIDKLIKIATDEVGYIEKNSLADLDSKVKNAGNNNFTKYAQELKGYVGSPFVNGVQWCATFVDWCFYKAYGSEKALSLLHLWTMSCGVLKDAFKAKGSYVKSPKAGDIVIFEWTDKGKLKRHTGLVYKVDSERIYTIEGNTNASANSVIENGGGVFKKSYLKNNPKIDGYCRPNYVIIPKPTLKRGKTNPKDQVSLLQKILNRLGYKDAEGKVLAVDGSFGLRTEEAVKAFQKAQQLAVDGSYGPRTAATLRSVMEGIEYGQD